MPFPLLIIGASVAAAAFGAKKHIDAKEMTNTAERLVRDAEEEFEDEKGRLIEKKEKLAGSARKLAALRKKAETKNIRRFLAAASQISDINYRQISISASIPETELPTLAQFNAEINAWSDLPTSGAKGVALGLMGAAGASGLATSIGVASTGTAISTLSGAAATNATLAWLGGGSLAAGGLGMTGGMVVLGGTIVGPLVAITGFAAASNAEKILTRAYEREAEVGMMTEQARDAQVMIAVIDDRVSEISTHINRFLPYFDQIISTVEAMVVEGEALRESRRQEIEGRRAAYEKVNVIVRFFNWLFRRTPSFVLEDPLLYRNLSPQQKDIVGVAMLAATNLKALININIIDESGKVTSESESAVQAVGAQMSGKPTVLKAPKVEISPPAVPKGQSTIWKVIKISVAVVILLFLGLIFLGWIIGPDEGESPQAATDIVLPGAVSPEHGASSEGAMEGGSNNGESDVFYSVSANKNTEQSMAVEAGEHKTSDIDASSPVAESGSTSTVAEEAVAAFPKSNKEAVVDGTQAKEEAARSDRPDVSPAGVNSAAINRMLARAESLLSEGRAQEALTVTNTILTFDPDNAAALSLREKAKRAAAPRW